MIISSQNNPLAVALWLAATLAVSAQDPDATADPEGLTELDAFIAEETAVEESAALSPLGRPVDHVFMEGMTVMEIPRAVTVLTPEAMEQFGLESFDDLPRAGASLQRPNYFGVPGAPYIRGSQAGVYYNGMKRMHGRNDSPMSFGSLEAMNIVKGPAPAHFRPTNTGGYVNFIPKSPYFDKFRGSVTATAGSWDYYNVQFDVGGPTLLLGKPAAYRVSVTGQTDDTYFNNLRNDYYSTYLAIKAKIDEDVSAFTGFEFYNHKSNENAGWNRVSQRLIDNNTYLVGGADPNTTAANFTIPRGPLAGTVVPVNGTADPALIGFPAQLTALGGGYDPNLALVVPTNTWTRRYGAPTGPGGTYVGGPAAAATPVFSGGQLVGYKYTPGYFAAGGDVFTAPISKQNVLADPNDYADSRNFLGFYDWENNRNAAMPMVNKTILEVRQNEKLSSYGYASKVRNIGIGNRMEFSRSEELWQRPLDLTFGGDVRYEYSWFVEDFSREPFNRRDLSRGRIPPESIVYAGPQLLWTQGQAAESTLVGTGLFAVAEYEVSDRLDVLVGGRLESVWFDYGQPDDWNGVQQASDRHDVQFGNWMISPVYKLTDWLSAYASVQRGTTETPSDHGTYQRGADNFNETDLYETGLKASLYDGKLFAQTSLFYWDKTNVASTPIGAESRAFRAKGFEVELTALPAKGLTLIGSFTAMKVYNRFTLPFRARYLTEQETALYAGAIQYGAPGNLGVPGTLAANPDWETPGFPQVNANFFAVYEFPNGFGVGAGPSWSDGYWGNYEHTLRYPSTTIWNANVFYRQERFEVFLRLSNLTDERWFRGNDGSFAANTITTPGEPFSARLSATWKF